MPDVPDLEVRAFGYALADHASGRVAPELAEVERARVTVRTLAALLFHLLPERECADVRARLAAGDVSGDGWRLAWTPVALTEAEFTAIERTFPAPLMREGTRLAPPAPTVAELVIPAAAPHLAVVPLNPEAGEVRQVARRAEYVRFDYARWADEYRATLTPAGVGRLLRSAERVPAAAVDAVAARLGLDAGTGSARTGAAAASARLDLGEWLVGLLGLGVGTLRDRRRARAEAMRQRELLCAGAGAFGATARFFQPRPGERAPYESLRRWLP